MAKKQQEAEETTDHEVGFSELLAAKIADDIFTDGQGREGKRLVFEYEDGLQDSTGYSKSGMQGIIAKILKDSR